MKKIDFTEEEMKIAHDKNGECQSCGWHAMFSEHEYDVIDRKSAPNEYWDYCKNSEVEDAEDHRGCYIYPKKLKT